MLVSVRDQVEDFRIIIVRLKFFLRIDKIISYIHTNAEMICQTVIFFEKNFLVFFRKLRHTFFCDRLQKKRGVLIINVP